MAPRDGGQPGEVRGSRRRPVVGEVAERFVRGDDVPVDDGVEGEAERAESFLLALAKRGPDRAALPVVDAPSQLVAQLPAVRLDERAAARGRVVECAQDVRRLDDPAELGRGRGRGRGRASSAGPRPGACASRRPPSGGRARAIRRAGSGRPEDRGSARCRPFRARSRRALHGRLAGRCARAWRRLYRPRRGPSWQPRSASRPKIASEQAAVSVMISSGSSSVSCSGRRARRAKLSRGPGIASAPRPLNWAHGMS